MPDILMVKDGKSRVVGTPARRVELEAQGWQVPAEPEPEPEPSPGPKPTVMDDEPEQQDPFGFLADS